MFVGVMEFSIQNGLAPQSLALHKKSVGTVRNVLAEKLLESIETPSQHRAESSAGVTSTHSKHGEAIPTTSSGTGWTIFDIQAARAREHARLANFFQG